VVYRAGKLNLMKGTIKRVLPTFEEFIQQFPIYDHDPFINKCCYFTGDKLTCLLKNNNKKVRLATF
jgi:hypothetical protein